jgi:predicted P-loop ATPase/5S rRNA maturation endonuclease (ribonuclease M5)
LYNLHLLNQYQTRQVIVVEGEKAADAARRIVGDRCIVTTWPGGTYSVDRTDWAPLTGRKVVVWPDADEPGKKAATQVANILARKAEKLKVIDPDTNDGWDAADAEAEGWEWMKWLSWAKERSVDLRGAKITVQQINIDAQDPPPKKDDLALWTSLTLNIKSNGHPYTNSHNGVRILRNHEKWVGKIWRDTFHDKIFTTWDGEESREWADEDTRDFMDFCQDDLHLHSMTEHTAFQSVSIYANRNKRNEVKDWLDSITWDGQPYISDFLVSAFGCPDTDYVRAVSRNFWLSMTARAIHPGVQVDTMLILEGKQGSRKTSALRAIGGRWYSTMNAAAGTLDFFQILQGTLLVEIEELSSFSNAETRTIKRVVATPVDRFRRSYGRFVKTYPRKCVFVGSTNEYRYLKDFTGARRFWPVKVKGINLEFVKRIRDQCFAEAYERVKKGEIWYDMPEEETLEEQESRRRRDPWEEVMGEYCKTKYDVKVADIITNCLHMEIAKADAKTALRIENILTMWGWDASGEGVVNSWRNPLLKPPVQEQVPF